MNSKGDSGKEDVGDEVALRLVQIEPLEVDPVRREGEDVSEQADGEIDRVELGHLSALLGEEASVGYFRSETVGRKLSAGNFSWDISGRAFQVKEIVADFMCCEGGLCASGFKFVNA